MYGVIPRTDFGAYRDALDDPTLEEVRTTQALGVPLSMDVVRFGDFSKDWSTVYLDTQAHPSFYKEIKKLLNLEEKETRKRKRTFVGKPAYCVTFFYSFSEVRKSFRVRHFPRVFFWNHVFFACRNLFYGREQPETVLPPFARLLLSRMPATIGQDLAESNIMHFLDVIMRAIVVEPRFLTYYDENPVPVRAESAQTLFLFTMAATTFIGLDGAAHEVFVRALFLGDLDDSDDRIMDYLASLQSFLYHGQRTGNIPLTKLLHAARSVRWEKFRGDAMFEFVSEIKEKEDGLEELLLPMEHTAPTFDLIKSGSVVISGCDNFVLHREMDIRGIPEGLCITMQDDATPVVILRLLDACFIYFTDRLRYMASLSNVLASCVCAATVLVDEVDADEEIPREQKEKERHFEVMATMTAHAALLYLRTIFTGRAIYRMAKILLPKGVMNWVRVCSLLPWALFAREGPQEKKEFMETCTREQASEVMLPLLETLPIGLPDVRIPLREWLLHFVGYSVAMTEPRGTESVHGTFIAGTTREEAKEIMEILLDAELEPVFTKFYGALQEFISNGALDADFTMRSGTVHCEFVDFMLSLPAHLGGLVLSKVYTIVDFRDVRKPQNTRLPHLPKQFVVPEESSFASPFHRLIGLVFQQAEAYVHNKDPIEPMRIPVDVMDSRVFLGDESHSLAKSAPCHIPPTPGLHHPIMLSNPSMDRIWTNVNYRFSIARNAPHQE